jgi:hypothetical protein
VEGHEYPVLDGLRQTLAKHRPFVLIEWADSGTRRSITEQRLFETLFADYDILVAGSNHDKQYWLKKPFGKWRRKLAQLTSKKKPLLYSFNAAESYDNILLIPSHRKAVLEQAQKAVSQ